MALPKEERYTYADYLGWDENEPVKKSAGRRTYTLRLHRNVVEDIESRLNLLDD